MSSDAELEAKVDEAEVSSYVYSPAPGWADTRANESTSGIGSAAAVGQVVVGREAIGGAAPGEEERKAREKRASEEGFREGFARAQADAEASVHQQRDAVTEAVRAFGAERDNYFHHVEGEVVALALAIVRKILKREAQTDPLLLSGLVRVALEKMAVSQNVRLRVHPSQIPIWNEYFSAHGEMSVKPELSGDATLEQNQCQIETELGVTDLSLETQLKEIELGLLDLLAQRPAPR